MKRNKKRQLRQPEVPSTMTVNEVEPLDWWQKALAATRALPPEERAWMDAVDRECARRARVGRREPSEQRCGYVRPGNPVPRFRNDWDKRDMNQWRHDNARVA